MMMVNEDDLKENNSLKSIIGRRSESPTLQIACSVNSPKSAVSVLFLSFFLFFVFVFDFLFSFL